MDYQLDRHIIESWRRHEHAERHISTERLMDMVRVDTGADVDCQIELLQQAGMYGNERAQGRDPQCRGDGSIRLLLISRDFQGFGSRTPL
jgi:hypothetical protein